MATIAFSITVPDGKQAEIIDAFVRVQGWTDTVPDVDGSPIPNPESKSDAAKRFIVAFVRNAYRRHKAEVDAALARDAAHSVVDQMEIVAG